MRHIIRDTLIACSATMLLLAIHGCAEDVMSSVFQTPIRLGASADVQVMEQASTRAGLEIQGSSFDEGEKIRIYILGTGGDSDANVCNPQGDAPTGSDSFFITDDADETTRLNPLLHTPTLYYPTEKRHVDIHAFYPARVKNTDNTFTVEYDQRGKDETSTLKYKNSDLMFAKIDDLPPTAGNVNLNFKHKMVKFIFNVVGDGDVDIEYAYLKGINRTAGFDPENGTITVLSGESRNYGDVYLDDAGAVIIPPQTLTGEFIAVKCKARQEGNPAKDGYATFSLSSPKVLEEGKVYTVNLSIGYDNVNAVYDLGKWNDDAGVVSVATKGTSGLSIIKKETISGVEHVYMEESYTYTTDSIKPEPVVRYGVAKTLTKGVDYDLQYFDDIHIGKATLLVIGKGSYEGFAVATSFTVEQAPGIVKYYKTGEETEQITVTKTYTRNSTVTEEDIKLRIVDNGTRHFASYLPDESGLPKEGSEADAAKIATVDQSGAVTIKGSGTVIVRAWTDGDGDYTATEDSYKLVIAPRDYHDESSLITIEVEGGPYTYNTKEQYPTVKVYDGEGESKVDITSSCTITCADKVSASPAIDNSYTVENTSERGKGTAINIKLNAPYSGETVRYYLIRKATPNLRLYNSYDMNTALTNTNGAYPDLYLALPNADNTATLSRTRVAITDFGVATITTTSTPSSLTQDTTDAQGNASTTSDYDHNTTSKFTAKGTSEANIDYTVAVAEDPNGNYYGVSATFTTHVVKSVDNYGYTGGTQKFTCQATGEYMLEVWGAQGGWANDAYSNGGTASNTYKGGPGAYVKGKIKLNKGETLYVNVGQKGDVITNKYHGFSTDYDAYDDSQVNPSKAPWTNTKITSVPVQGGPVGMQTVTDYTKIIIVGDAWNGGAGSVWGLAHHNTYSPAENKRDHFWDVRDPLSGGGGATDISLDWSGAATNWKSPEHLLTRIIVAGGGGGACYYSGESGNAPGASGGGGAITAEGMAGVTSTPQGKMIDPGEGGQINRGGKGGIYLTTRNSYLGITKPHDGRPTGWSGADGIFGEGGYYYCIEEGSGCGGGGWYGGGAAGQSSGNGSGGGGSSYIWCTALASYYPTATSLWNVGKGYSPTVASHNFYYMYNGSTVKSVSERTYRYLYDASSAKNANEGANNSTNVDGKAKITLLSTSDTVNLDGRN